MMVVFLRHSSRIGQLDQMIMIYIIYILTYRYDIFCAICMEQIQPRKRVLDHAG